MNRRSDVPWLFAGLLGAGIVGGTFYLRFVDRTLSDWAFALGVFVGAGMISPKFVLDMVLRWRARR